MSSSHCWHVPKLPSGIRRRAARAFRSWLNSRSRLQTASARSEAAWISSNWSALLSIVIPSRWRVKRSSSATFAVRIARNRSSSLLVIGWLLTGKPSLSRLHYGSGAVYLHPTMEAPRNTQITVPGGATFGGYETNLHMSVPPLLKSFSIAVPANPKAHRNWPALLEPAAYVFDGRVRWDHIGNNHPSVGIPRHQRNRPADLWRHRSRRSLIVLGVAGFFAAWVCKIGRGVSETPLRSSPTAAKSQSASVRTGAHLRTTLQAPALLVQRLKPRAGRASRDRSHATGLDIAPRQPSAPPRPESTNQAATALRNKPPPLPECPRSGEARSAV